MTAHFAARVRCAMKLRRIRQRDLAPTLGVSQASVSKWVRGDALPEMRRLPALAAALGVTPGWLVTDAPPMTEAEAREMVLSERGGR